MPFTGRTCFSSYVIRKATLDDAARICELEYLLFPENSLSLAQVERELVAHEAFVTGDPIHAYALVGWDDALLDLLRLGVHPDRQRHGDGEALLRFVLALNDTVILTVKKDNHRALSLYKKYGFEVVGHFIEARAWALSREVAGTSCPSR